MPLPLSGVRSWWRSLVAPNQPRDAICCWYFVFPALSLRADSPNAQSETRFYIAEIALALQSVHQLNYMHR